MRQLIIYAGIFILLIFILLFLIKFIIKNRQVLFSAILGMLGLFVVNALTGVTGISIGYNVISIVISVILGLPGVVFLLIERLI